MTMQTKIAFGLIAGASLVLAGAAHAAPTLPFSVSYESEAPGIQYTTSQFTVSGVENFDSLPVGDDQSFTTDFGTNGQITGTYAGAGGSSVVQINAADEYGGSGGTGNYAVAFNNTPYSVSLSSTISGGVNYFGYWLSALDGGNEVTFYSNGKALFTFEPQDVINAIKSTGNAAAYYGNPTANFNGQDGSEPFVFLNFYDTAGTFDKITFTENPNFGGGYESDNHTVGHYTGMSGTNVTLTHSHVGGVPEPASWALMIVGMGMAGGALRGRRAPRAALAI